MKKVIVLCFVVLVIIAPTFLFTGGCSNPEICVTPSGPDYHYIRFTLDGPEIDAENIILNFGVDKDINSPTLTLWPDGGGDGHDIEMSGWYCRGGQDTSIHFILWIVLMLDTPGVYIGTYGGQGPSIGSIRGFSFEILEDGEWYYYNSYNWEDSTLTITTFGDVGGDVEGTFDLTIGSDIPAPSYGFNLTAIGEFRFLRVPDQYL